MNRRTLNELAEELASRSFRADGTSPNGTMTLDEEYLLSVDLVDLFDTVVARREKVFRSADVVGTDAAKHSFDDVVLAIEAIKAVIRKLELP
jgi:hypothetical protein